MPADGAATRARRGGAGTPLARLRFEADAGAVRLALAQTRAALARLRLSEECLGDIELVLAEVLNNILLHAYGEGPGRIDLDLALGRGELICTLEDQGCPMPDGRPPEGAAASVDVPHAALPEGGFGWFLIRSHATALSYCREAAVNRLTLHLPLQAAAPR